MFSKLVKRAVATRFAIIKHSGCALMYWDKRSDLCVLSSTCMYWNYCVCYSIVAVGILMVLQMLYHLGNTEEIPEAIFEGTSTQLYPNSVFIKVALLVAGVMVVVGIFCLLIVSILIQMKEEVCQFINACFELDKRLEALVALGKMNGMKTLRDATITNSTYDALFPPTLYQNKVTFNNAWFIVEFLARLTASPVKSLFIKNILNIIDFTALFPYIITLLTPSVAKLLEIEPDSEGGPASFYLLRLLRLARVFRIFKLSKHSKGLDFGEDS
ncbi:unnamed protein product [Orchesella dallaii]|uniref:Ion transport domain-containing protein n=1 Tax=Orchesella dallaii TaxID=48710 RepID=A0ABP1RFP9_9HEXA